MGAVIDDKAFAKICGYIADAKKNATIMAGGGCNDKTGYFIEPTIVQAKKPDYRLMCEEIFGPVLTTYVYNDKDWARMLKIVDTTSPYALTGAVFAQRSARDSTGVAGAPERGGQLLHQRQADRRRRGSPAVRRRRGRPAPTTRPARR